MIPISHIIIRNYLGTTLGWDQAGYWQGICYISSIYLMIVTTALSTYYLPKLSETTNNKELKKEIILGYKLIMPIVVTCALLIYLLKDIIITILFTQNFTPMRDLFLWQVIGDVLKIASWLLAYLMLAKAMIKLFIITEIIFGLTFILFSYLFTHNYGLIGMSYAHCINYVLYLITAIVTIIQYIKKNQ